MIYKSPKELELIEKLGPVIASLNVENFELRDIEVRQGQPGLIRITIDLKDRSRGVNLDDCYEVHKVLDPLFDVWDPLQAQYTLEVSSPGEKAPLRSFQHFEEAIGEEVEFKTRQPLKIESNPTAAPRRNWKGKLLAVFPATKEKPAQLQLEDPMGTHFVDAELIEQARWLRNWTKKVEPIQKKNPKNSDKNLQKRPKK